MKNGNTDNTLGTINLYCDAHQLPLHKDNKFAAISHIYSVNSELFISRERIRKKRKCGRVREYAESWHMATDDLLE